MANSNCEEKTSLIQETFYYVASHEFIPIRDVKKLRMQLDTELMKRFVSRKECKPSNTPSFQWRNFAIACLLFPAILKSSATFTDPLN